MPLETGYVRLRRTRAATVGRHRYARHVKVLTTLQLNRATLARQSLLERAVEAPLAAVHRLGGLQAQEAASPYLALWTRLEHFDPADLDRAILDRQLVKATLMRGTLHLVTAGDYARWHPALFDALRRRWLGAVLAQGSPQELLEEALAFAQVPRANTALREHLARESPPATEPGRITPAEDAWTIIRRYAPVIHTPAAVTWSYPRRPSYVAATAWLDGAGPADELAGLEALVRTYLGAFGPATNADLSQWSGLPVSRLGLGLDRIAGIVRSRDEAGRTLLDLPNGPLPDPDTPAPPRLLPMWDSVLLAHDVRTRVLPDVYRKAVIARNGDVLPTFLVDGFVAGLWWAEEDPPGTARIRLEPFSPLKRPIRVALEEEAERLAAFIGPHEPRVFGRYRWRQPANRS